MKSFWDELWDELRPYIRYLAGFSLLINLLYLAPAMFSLQVFDRVLSSNSLETLIMLMLGTGVALLLMLMLDYLRSRLQSVVGAMLADRLSPPVVNAIVARGAHAAGRRRGRHARRRHLAQPVRGQRPQRRL